METLFVILVLVLWTNSLPVNKTDCIHPIVCDIIDPPTGEVDTLEMLQYGLISLQSSPQSVTGLTTLLPFVGSYLGLNTSILLTTIQFVTSQIGSSIPPSGTWDKLSKLFT